MTQTGEPLLVLDADDHEQRERIISTPGLLTQLQDWARAHGVDPDDTYRFEIHVTDHLFAKVFQYEKNERGQMFCSVDHDHRADRDRCEPARRDPYDVNLTSLPPLTAGGVLMFPEVIPNLERHLEHLDPRVAGAIEDYMRAVEEAKERLAHLEREIG